MEDSVAVEAPLEVRVLRPSDAAPRSVAVTMRTPGHDEELAVGFLVSEGALNDPAQVQRVAVAQTEHGAIAQVSVRDSAPYDPEALTRHVYATSSCGVCGRAQLDRVRVAVPELSSSFTISAALVGSLPAALRAAQPAFAATGGTHGAALVDASGTRLLVREDVGRHNAVDKLLGRRFLDGAWPVSDAALVLSGRASFELVQKALALGVRAVVCVGAPSSAAVALADEFGALLAGFVRADRFNVYAGLDRLTELPPEDA